MCSIWAHSLFAVLSRASQGLIWNRGRDCALSFSAAKRVRGQGEGKEMITENEEPCRVQPECMIRIGIASWSNRDEGAISVKYAWPDKNGKVSRGGEVPVEALPQMLELAIKTGHLHF